MKRGSFAASPAQRAKVRDLVCLVCRQEGVDPAHLIPRSLGGCDHADCVIPLCRTHHTAFDEHRIDILSLWPRYVPECQHAIGHVGPSNLITRLTGKEWMSVEAAA